MANFFKTYAFLFYLLTAVFSLRAQSLDTLINIDEVVITAERLSLSLVGNRQELLDSARLALFRQNNLVEVLSLQSNIFIKNYGPGNSATTTLRGAASAHTPVLWNGFNLQSPMLGQVDLSLLPVLFTDEIKIQYAAAALYGAAAPLAAPSI